MRSSPGEKLEELRVGPTLVGGAENVVESATNGRPDRTSPGHAKNRRWVCESTNSRKPSVACSKSAMEECFAYVRCAFVAGAVIAFACLIHSSIFSKESKLHWIVDNAVEAAVTAFPDSSLVRQLRIYYPSNQGKDPLGAGEERVEAMLAEVSEQIKRDPDNLDLRLRRAGICQLQQTSPDRGAYLQCALQDVEYVVLRRGTSTDWAHLALLQGMNNDPKWLASLEQSKKLGYKLEPEGPRAGSINWVVGTLRDGGFRQANIIPWLRTMSGVTGNHSADYFIATIYLQAGKYEEAAREYESLIKNGVERESHVAFYLLRGACLKWSGHPELAKKAFRNCIASRGEANSACKAIARGALGDRSLEKTLNGQRETERVLYYVLSDQYEKAVQVTGTGRTRPIEDSFGNGESQVLGIGANGYDQFEMATGVQQLPQLEAPCKDILEGPPNDSEMIAEGSANIHFLKEMSYRKINNEKLAAEEHSRAVKLIPPNLRRELHVQ